MRGYQPLLFATAAVAAGLVAGLSFERVYDIQMRKRPADSLAAAATNRPDARARAPLPLRLVDSGGVGIPLDTWGVDYSHDRRVFRDAILTQAPYVDAAAFQSIQRDWRTYVERMRQYGNNAISVPMLLELIDFDRVTSHHRAPGEAVYDRASTYRERHDAVRRSFTPLFEWTARQGMQVFLEADMLTLSAPLAEYLRRLAPDSSSVGIDTSDPAVWGVYRAGLEELFERVPAVAGLVIRFGEGGNLYNTEGWPYRSEVAIRNASSLRAMLRGLLPAFERSGRTLVLRNWTVGVGSIGRLHTDPRVYDAVLGDIDSPSLVVSTKFTAGDFFSYLPLNPTLARGRHRRLIELQAKPEFEGFSAFPDFLGQDYARAVRALRTTNPQVVGTFLFTQNGGPLRAGPRTLYPLHGFWLWTDANVFVASRLAIDPDADVATLAREWAASTFSRDPGIVEAVATALNETRTAVLDGFYIRPFAEREVRVPGLELPPLMWIFEWDMVGGWHSLLSLVYSGTRDEVHTAIEQGHAAAGTVRRVRQRLATAFSTANPADCSSCSAALRSLDYQESVFDVLAEWRQSFLSYYQWLDTGSDDAWREWRVGRSRFEATASRHRRQFGNDLDFPALDLTSAARAIAVADRGASIRTVAIGIVVVVMTLIVVGSMRRRDSRSRIDAVRSLARLTWIAVVAPWRLATETVDLRIASAVTALALLIVGFLMGTLTGFASPWVEAGSVLVVAVVAVAFESTASAAFERQGRGRLLLAAVAPLVPGAIVLLAVIAYASPLGFWYWFWTSPVFRVVFVSIVVATAVWAVTVIVAVRVLEGWHGSIAGWLTAVGAGLLVLTALLPEWPVALRSLDRPLNVAPATTTMLFALQTYAGAHIKLGGLFYLAALLLAAGYAARRLSQRRGRRIPTTPACS
jgi:hypothetical protein